MTCENTATSSGTCQRFFCSGILHLCSAQKTLSPRYLATSQEVGIICNGMPGVV